jgi:hypothetical protein
MGEPISLRHVQLSLFTFFYFGNSLQLYGIVHILQSTLLYHIPRLCLGTSCGSYFVFRIYKSIFPTSNRTRTILLSGQGSVYVVLRTLYHEVLRQAAEAAESSFAYIIPRGHVLDYGVDLRINCKINQIVKSALVPARYLRVFTMYANY